MKTISTATKSSLLWLNLKLADSDLINAAFCHKGEFHYYRDMSRLMIRFLSRDELSVLACCSLDYLSSRGYGEEMMLHACQLFQLAGIRIPSSGDRSTFMNSHDLAVTSLVTVWSSVV